MTHTVVGLFEDRSDAQAAMNDLVAAGFIKENIDISNRQFAEGSSDTAYADKGEGIGDRIANFFNSLFGDDETTASNYTNAASDAEAILTVHPDSDERARLAQEIMDRNDAIDVDEHGAKYADHNLTGTAANRNTTDTTAKIPVVEEKLNVGKRQVESGGARIRSRVIEKPVEENVRLREEHVVVNRRPVDREVTEGDLKNFQPGEMEITERAEVPVVGKQARVVEEVEVGKNVTEREETVRDTVRTTDVDVEEIRGETDAAAKAKRAKP
jgi:stress response protein YsnF